MKPLCIRLVEGIEAGGEGLGDEGVALVGDEGALEAGGCILLSVHLILEREVIHPRVILIHAEVGRALGEVIYNRPLGVAGQLGGVERLVYVLQQLHGILLRHDAVLLFEALLQQVQTPLSYALGLSGAEVHVGHIVLAIQHIHLPVLRIVLQHIFKHIAVR